MADSLIIYHANCLDGFTAAWIVARALDRSGESYELLPAAYGEPPPPRSLYDEKVVFIVDFSYPRDTLLAMWECCHGLRVLDHHATAKDELRGLDFAEFDMNRSGAGMALDWLNGEAKAIGPGGEDLVDFIEDYDLWRWDFEETLPLHYYFTTIDQTLTNWDLLAHNIVYEYTSCLQKGHAIQRYADKLISETASHAYKGRLPVWGGYKRDVLICNCPPKLISLVGERLLSIYEREPMVAMFWQDSKKVFQFSLRSRSADECNVAKLAEQYNGGGHKQAAGFRSGEL